ncbi:hypothetical protein BG015_011304 [Linnemannia schmuckeri]|uniref:Uncharacterized protein n=1 Tax=Linnemannia schmuckeri TaxID=64567 RepID=A0A9P5RSS8_9FUNG|nr:hypothetical protein BG015_011304 [Linnemannia schmuckeri]
MVYYNTEEFERFFQDPPLAKRLEWNSYRQNRRPELPPPVPVDANGEYHGLEFNDAGTNAVRIFLASQYLAHHLPSKISYAEDYDLSLSRHGPIFHDLATDLTRKEPTLAGVTGPALFQMFDQIVDKYRHVHNMLSRGWGDHMEETRLMRFCIGLHSVDSWFLEVKVKMGEELEESERRRWVEEEYGSGGRT